MVYHKARRERRPRWRRADGEACRIHRPAGRGRRHGRRPGCAPAPEPIKKSCVRASVLFKHPKSYRALLGHAEQLISLFIQQSGRLGIIRRFKNLDTVEPRRARIKVIQVIPPRALRRGKRNVFSRCPLIRSNTLSNFSEA